MEKLSLENSSSFNENKDGNQQLISLLKKEFSLDLKDIKVL